MRLVALSWLVFIAAVVITTRAQCPDQLPSGSTCSDSSWIVNQTFFVLTSNLDVSLAAVNFTGSYLQFPNATITVSWETGRSGVINVADDALVSGTLLVRFLSRPPKGLKLTVLNAGNIIGGFQNLSIDKNYSRSGCDGVTLAVTEQDASSPTTSIQISVSRGDACKTDKHIPLIVVCVLSGSVMLAVIIYMCITEAKMCRGLRNWLSE